MSKPLFYNQPAGGVLPAFTVTQAEGLSKREAARRLGVDGANELPSGPKTSIVKLFLSQFKDVLIIVLIIAATVSLGISFIEEDGSATEALLIYGIVVAIAIVGFFNEYKAEKTVEALRKLVSETCHVRRDGTVVSIPAREVVPGDIIVLEEGQKIPADIRLLEANRLQINEASLTGESLPVTKISEALRGTLPLGDQTNMAFSGTIVTTGTAEGVVVATGAQTEIGRIARLVSSVENDETPMQRKLDDLGKKLGLVILIICAVVFVTILTFDHHIDKQTLLQRLLLAFTAAVALAVAAIPEGLAFVVRISLALGARRMAAKNALVRKLSAVESLGSTDVVCSDKTGTLTKGEMTVRVIYAAGQSYEVTGTGYCTKGQLQKDGHRVAAPREVLDMCEAGVLCNNASVKNERVLGDPTEGCLLVSAAKTGLLPDRLRAKMPRLHEIPFSSDRKMMSTLHKTAKGYIVYAKGAPDILIGHCSRIIQAGGPAPLNAILKNDVHNKNQELSAQALRVLGFAYAEFSHKPTEAEMETNLTFIGLQGMMDPPRTEVKAVIQRVQAEAGMRVIMITGDNIETAKAVAREIGIEGGALSGMELDALSEAQFAKQVEHIGIYARVNPEHKIKIVRALQKHHHQVAMTGDGVNDAPAIKAADIGIAMGITGTDAAKEAADMILLDDQFLTIIKAVEEGRGIYDNVRKFVNFLLSCNIGEVITVFLGILFFNNLVLTAVQLLFINIVTDGLPAVALGSDPAARNVMRFSPKRYQQAIITKRLWWEIGIFGTLMSVALLLHYWFSLHTEGVVVATSAVFMAMVVYEFVRLIDIRTDYHIPFFANPLLAVSVLVSLAIQVALFYVPPLATIFGIVPPDAQDWLIILIFSLGLFGIMKLLNPLLNRVGPENETPSQAQAY